MEETHGFNLTTFTSGTMQQPWSLYIELKIKQVYVQGGTSGMNVSV